MPRGRTVCVIEANLAPTWRRQSTKPTKCLIQPGVCEMQSGELSKPSTRQFLSRLKPKGSHMTRNPKLFGFPLHFGFCWAEPPQIFSGFWGGGSFSTGRERPRPKSDHAHPAFSCFFPFLTPQKNHENPRLPLHLQNPFPWNHAQMTKRKILCRIALTRALYDQIRP